VELDDAEVEEEWNAGLWEIFLERSRDEDSDLERDSLGRGLRCLAVVTVFEELWLDELEEVDIRRLDPEDPPAGWRA